MKIIIVLLIVLCSTTVLAIDSCIKPNEQELDAIKKIKLQDVEEWVKSSEAASEHDTKLTMDNISIIQSYKKGSYIMAEHSFDCCFEGYIALYKIQKDRSLKEIEWYNGYNKDGVFIGFDPKVVKKYFKKHVPKNIKPMIDCWN